MKRSRGVSRNRSATSFVYQLKMGNQRVDRNPRKRLPKVDIAEGRPLPTMQFRRRAWLEFQRALDPLAPPKPFRIDRH